MPPKFSIDDAETRISFSLSDILSLSTALQIYCDSRQLNYFALRGGSLFYSLFFQSALFLSDINYLILPSTFSNRNLELTLPPCSYECIEPSDSEFIRIISFVDSISSSSSYHSNPDPLEDARSNRLRQIGYFSSGSTGKPKLIIITSHMAFNCFLKVCPLISSQQETFLKQLCFHDPSFVISLCYICIGLISDIPLLCIPSANPLFLANTLQNHGSRSLIISVPSLWDAILDLVQSLNIRLHTTISCGEPLRTATGLLLSSVSTYSSYNFYGSTELATWAFYYELTSSGLQALLDSNSPYVPIGVPLPGVTFIQSTNSELCISCDHSSRLYIKEGISVKPRYLSINSPDDFFMTGDRISYDSPIPPNVFCNGRVDSLIKVRGAFIDLYEIQSFLVDLLGNAKFAIVKSGYNSLVIYIESSKLNNNDLPRLHAILVERSTLILGPRIPVHFVFEETLRLNRSSKIDKAYYSNLPCPP
jgi:hypothetical protein